ncbi:MAG TPA: O-antigen ligase family protein [Solirubrobacteraceae bacterium]|nr:O-antigen ligase family protein [Solirubrobacteraceae bacterium]
MIAFAALTGPLPKAGVVVVAALAAVVMTGPPTRGRGLGPRARAVAMLGALVLAPVLLLSDIWSSPQLNIVHRHPLEAVVGAAVVVAALIAAAALIVRRQWLVAPLAVLALPFRVPVSTGATTASGTTTANLLVPLYFVVAAGALAWIYTVLRGSPEPEPPPARAGDLVVWVPRLLALYVVLYGIQAWYSPKFEVALQNMVFFYVPFAVLLALLRDARWDRRVLRACLGVTMALAVAFSFIGFFEYATKTVILSSKLAIANGLHTYFTVNSVFLDPDIFGRYLALVMILLAAALIYDLPQRVQGTVTLVLAVLWAGLVLTLSRSSLAALLVGLAVLAALRWKPGRALVVAVVVIALGAIAVAASPKTFGLNQGINGASSGRGGLVSGGLSLFADRPVWGYGSGSFVTEYRRHHRLTATSLSASHTIPITVAAEQGLIGELAYLAFVISAILCVVRRARGDPVRSAVAAALVALLFHTLLYADFLEDPTTWVLLGVGLALAAAPIAPAGARPGDPGAPDLSRRPPAAVAGP